MYTANILSTNALPDGRINVQVQFSNGTTTLPPETIIPSDKNGLDFAVKGRLDALNFTPPAIGAYVLPVAPTITPPTQQDLDFAAFSRQMQVLIALNAAKSLGVITGAETLVINTLAAIKTSATANAGANLTRLFL